MKRWLGMICVLALFGTISVGDPLFGLTPEMRPHVEKCRNFLEKQYGNLIDHMCHIFEVQGKPGKCSGKTFKSAWAFGSKKFRERGLRRFVRSAFSHTSRPMGKKVTMVVERVAPKDCSVEHIVEKKVVPEVPQCVCKQSKKRVVKEGVQSDFYSRAMHKEKRKKVVKYCPPQTVASQVDRQDDRVARPIRCASEPYQIQPAPYTQSQPIQPQPVLYSQPQPIQYAQPIMQQQLPVYQNNNGVQIASCAMQMQASAMAMQAQASAMMMQAQQQQPPMMMQQPFVQPVVTHNMQTQPFQNTKNLPRKEKLSLLMQYFQQLSEVADYDVQRILLLLDAECDIIERLLSRGTAQEIEARVSERNVALKESGPFVQAVYNLMIDLATTAGDAPSDVRLYHYFVRRSKRSQAPIHAGSSKKEFLMQMMYQLEQYYQIIENMRG